MPPARIERAIPSSHRIAMHRLDPDRCPRPASRSLSAGGSRAEALPGHGELLHGRGAEPIPFPRERLCLWDAAEYGCGRCSAQPAGGQDSATARELPGTERHQCALAVSLAAKRTHTHRTSKDRQAPDSHYGAGGRLVGPEFLSEGRRIWGAEGCTRFCHALFPWWWACAFHTCFRICASRLAPPTDAAGGVARWINDGFLPTNPA